MKRWLKLTPLMLLPVLASGDHIPRYPLVEQKPLFKPSKTVQTTILPLPADAVRAALIDALNVPSQDLPFTRWFWDRRRQRTNFQAVSHVVNSNSRDSVIHPPIPAGMLVRIDLRWYAPTLQDLQDWLITWEKLAFDPSFAKLVTRDQLKVSQVINTVSFPKAGFWGSEAQGWRWKVWQQEIKVDDVVVIRFNPRHLQQSGIEKLQAATLSFAPIVEIGYFVGRAASTVKDKEGKKDGVFSIVWGGLYYEFSGVRRSSRKGVTDLDQLIEDLGILGTPYQKLFDDKLRSDERAALFRSGVTGKPRRIDWFGTPKSRLSVASGVVFITNDLRNRDVDFTSHPLLNLFKIKPAAYEVIFTRSNGMQGYAIFGADQERLDFADGNEIVSDTTVPDPHTKVLQPMISCERCHGPHDGIRPFTNDAQKLLRPGSRFNVYGDLSQLKTIQSDTISRLAGWYSGNPWKPLERARSDYDEAVLRSTGPWPESKSQTHVVGVSAKQIGEIYKRDRFDLVTPAVALEELGGIADNGKEMVELSRILPPSLRNPVTGIVHEDGFLAALMEGLSINRFEWSLVYADALERRMKVK